MKPTIENHISDQLSVVEQLIEMEVYLKRYQSMVDDNHHKGSGSNLSKQRRLIQQTLFYYCKDIIPNLILNSKLIIQQLQELHPKRSLILIKKKIDIHNRLVDRFRIRYTTLEVEIQNHIPLEE